MPNIIVSEMNGKYNVLINYIQQGISYSSKKLAESEANKIRAKYKNTK